MSLVNIGSKGPRKPILVEKNVDDKGTSPMDAPDARAPPGDGQSVPYEDMHPLLQEFRDDHTAYIAELDAVEKLLARLQQQGPDQEADAGLGRFFRFLETVVFPHNRREEKLLFPLLAKRLIESGEHSAGPKPTTGIDVLESDHVEVVQLSAVMLNFFGVAGHLPDERSQRLIIEAGIEQGKTLVENLRLHIFREDNVIFSLAHNLISNEEFDQMQRSAG